MMFLNVLFIPEKSSFFRSHLSALSSIDSTFNKTVIRPDSCIHHLIPEKRDESILSRLRNPSQYSIPLARTERFKKSFVLCALRSFPTDSEYFL